MVKPPTAPEYPLKSYDQKLFGNDGTRTADLCIWQCLTLEPLGQFQSVFHENSLEFSAQSNGKASDSPRVSIKKFWPKIVWNCWDSNHRPLHLTVSNFGTVGSISKCFTWKQLRIFSLTYFYIFNKESGFKIFPWLLELFFEPMGWFWRVICKNGGMLGCWV